VTKKHAFEFIGICIVIGLIALGLHLDSSYRSLVASTAKAPAYYSASTLAAYNEELVSYLDENQTELAVISRAGQVRDKLPEGINYTHSAFVISDEDSGYKVYNLYHGEEDRRSSYLIADSIPDFLGPTRARDIGLLIPTPEFQSKLKAHILSSDYGNMHTDTYSLISNPFDTRFQNCNEFLLDEMASVAFAVKDRGQIKEQLKKLMDPTKIKAGFIRRHIAPFVDERLIMDDHDKVILTTTRQDLGEFLDKQGQLSFEHVLIFKSDPAPAP